MRRFVLFTLFIAITGISCKREVKLTQFVNLFIGTAGHGHTYPGATLPFGMVQLSPDTRKDSWDGCSGYHYSDTLILGFSHTHLSGTGVGDYGDIRFMATTGKLSLRPGAGENEMGYASAFSHDHETASPGYYSVFLEDFNIIAEMTATSRCGFQRYIFPESTHSNFIIDLKESVVTETNLDLMVEFISDHEICGYRKSSGWAENQTVYFYSIFSRPFSEYGIAVSGDIIPGSKVAQGHDIQAYVRYNTTQGEAILVKSGISATSVQGARKNLEAEISHWDFDQIRISAEEKWEKALSIIKVEGNRPEDKVKFYSALYHCLLAPNLFSDVDGSYLGHDGKVHPSAGFDIYTVFSLWDTYRALHPLLSIIQPEITVDFIKTFLDIYDKGGLLPVWELAGNETNCMIGYHAVPVIADSYIKGIEGFDVEKAYEAAKASAEQDHFGLNQYKRRGYIPAEMEGESISRTLEYAYDDWCIAVMANALGKEDDYRYYIQRAQSYKNIYDPETGFLRGKRNGMFTQPFDPAEVNFMLTEANTWQYTFYVPQDITGLKNLMGGDEIFEAKLDEMFQAATGISGRQQADITGLIGQYAHGNEPSHHMAYLYNYAGKAHKTQRLVRQIMDDLYGCGPDGLCGNEDCGQMSAWFVMSAMGFYPVTPGSGQYVIGSPLFNEVRINVGGGKEFIIHTNNRASEDIYIQSARLAGQDYPNSYLLHSDIMKGGELEFEMSSDPNTEWAESPTSRPRSSISDNLIVPVPFFKAASTSFQDTLLVEIKHIDPEVDILYSYDATSAAGGLKPYRFPLRLTGSADIVALATDKGKKTSMQANASFYKIHNDWTVDIKFPYSAQYTGGGAIGLIDGQRGNINFRTGSWQGYEGVDFEAVIDLGSQKRVSKVSASFLQDQRSWIFMPLSLEISLSNNGEEFTPAGTIANDVPDREINPIIKEFISTAINTSTRYIKVAAKNRGTCPSWHPGAGGKAWIFIDEIKIE